MTDADELAAVAIAAARAAWPTDSEYVADWVPADQELHRRAGWLSFRERNEAVLAQRQERVARAILNAICPRVSGVAGNPDKDGEK